MKKIMLTAGMLFTCIVSAQVAIGKDSVEIKGILDFGSDNDKGIILPIAEISETVTYANGSMLMDKNDLKVKVFQENGWLELSEEGSIEVQFDESNNPLSTAAVFNESDETGEGVIIGEVDGNGNTSSGASGVLVLEADDKALILPNVASPHITVKSPVAGTLCYDTDSDSLAVFDGKVWNYWK
nr:hypothetical protein [uncultured Chryseobacterium sp.]